MERLPQTLHTYIQPDSPRGRHKQRQHTAAMLLQHCQDVGPISQELLNSCQWVKKKKIISANSLQEMCFLIRPSSTETDKIQKTTEKARGTDYEGERGRAGVLVMEAGAGIYHTH